MCVHATLPVFTTLLVFRLQLSPVLIYFQFNVQFSSDGTLFSLMHFPFSPDKLRLIQFNSEYSFHFV